ncbi:MAG: hypothetical protein ACYC3X_23370 [Pirellulaceae bacterium]
MELDYEHDHEHEEEGWTDGRTARWKGANDWLRSFIRLGRRLGMELDYEHDHEHEEEGRTDGAMEGSE